MSAKVPHPSNPLSLPASSPRPSETNHKHTNQQSNPSTDHPSVASKRKSPQTQAQNQAPPCKKNKTSTKNKRGPGYSTYETTHLLNLLEEFLPITSHEWHQLRDRHHEAFMECFRTVTSLRRKFYTLQRATKSSDPRSFSYRARRISAWIKHRAKKGDAAEQVDSCSLVSTKVFDRKDDDSSYLSGEDSEEQLDDDRQYDEDDDDDDHLLMLIALWMSQVALLVTLLFCVQRRRKWN